MRPGKGRSGMEEKMGQEASGPKQAGGEKKTGKNRRKMEATSYRRTDMQKEMVIRKLRERGCRITRQRLMLIDIILEEECSCCKEIFYRASEKNPGIGPATVYRLVNMLEEIGAISRKNMYRIDFGPEEAGEEACAVELDDSSHERADHRQRDAFMDKAFSKAKLPLFHIPCRKSYGAKELNELCSFLCQDLLVLQDEEEGPACPAGTTRSALPLCPDCGVPMVLRTASRGPHQGEQFYGCPNFPRCRRTRPYRGE